MSALQCSSPDSNQMCKALAKMILFCGGNIFLLKMGQYKDIH